MAGILDSKTRILDNVVTEVGRAQISSGKLRIEYASLTDAQTYYEFDEVSGSSDATARFYFEASGKKKQDLITFETDDSGKLMGYPDDLSLTLRGDELFKKAGSTSTAFEYVSGTTAFASLSAGLITGSIDNFNQLYMLGSVGSPEDIALQRAFKLSREDVEFLVLNTHPFIDGPTDSVANIDSVEPFFTDKRLSHIPNFKFLPPMKREPMNPRGPFSYSEEVQKSASELGSDHIEFAQDAELEEIERTTGVANRGIIDRAKENVFLGNYTSLGEAGLDDEGYSYQALMLELNGPQSQGVDPDWATDIVGQADLVPYGEGDVRATYPLGTVFGQQRGVMNLSTIEVARDRRSIFFSETSPQNNIVMQMFEVNDGKKTFKKLDVIDFGEFNTSSDPMRPNKHVFFAGKIYQDGYGIPTFVNLFTIILD